MKPSKVARQIEELIVESTELFGNRVYLAEKRLYNEFLSLLNKLEIEDGYIKQNAANRAILAKAEQSFNDSISQSGYQDAINKALDTIPRIDTINTAYFESVDSAFQVNRRFLSSLQANTIKTLETTLLNEGLQAEIKTPLLNILNQNINAGGSFQGMLDQVRGYIEGTPDREGKLLRYSKQLLKDTLFQYSRAYQESVTSDLGLDWYLYEGGLMQTSRPFCVARAGKFWHRKEIESWASLTWAGQAEGTTESSIFVLVGGYNCQHSLIPVHQSIVEESDKKRFSESGFE